MAGTSLILPNSQASDIYKFLTQLQALRKQFLRNPDKTLVANFLLVYNDLVAALGPIVPPADVTDFVVSNLAIPVPAAPPAAPTTTTTT